MQSVSRETSSDLKKRESILRLQAAMFDAIGKGDMEEYEAPVVHHFAPGLYARECHIAKGITIIGKIHKHAHVNTISKGVVRVFTEHHAEPVIYEAPYTFVSEPGTKRAVLALEDTIWTTYHPTEETDLEKIEEEVIAESYEELEMHLCYEQRKQLETEQ